MDFPLTAPDTAPSLADYGQDDKQLLYQRYFSKAATSAKRTGSSQVRSLMVAKSLS
jgi:hypothetical protein